MRYEDLYLKQLLKSRVDKIKLEQSQNDQNLGPANLVLPLKHQFVILLFI